MTVISDGQDAVDHVKDGVVADAVVLDLDMPRLNGLSVLVAMRGNPKWKTVPIIIFTGTDSEAARYTCDRLGASYFQLKPSAKTGFAAFATFLRAGLENGTFTK